MAKILIADDDPNVRAMLRFALEIRGANVLEAINGVHAIRLVQEAEPDVVVVDVIMPDVDGLETISTIREVRPNTQIIAVSGGGRVGNLDLLEMAARLGADATFSKPFGSNDIIECLERQLRVPIGKNL